MLYVNGNKVQIAFHAPLEVSDGILRDQLKEQCIAIIAFPDEFAGFDFRDLSQGFGSSWAACAIIHKNCVKITSGEMFTFSEPNSGYSVNGFSAFAPDPKVKFGYYVFFGMLSEGVFNLVGDLLPSETKESAVISRQIAEAFIPNYNEAGGFHVNDLLALAEAAIYIGGGILLKDVKMFSAGVSTALLDFLNYGYRVRFPAIDAYTDMVLTISNIFDSRYSKTAGFLNMDLNGIPGLGGAYNSDGFFKFLGFSASNCIKTPGLNTLGYTACFSPDFSKGPFKFLDYGVEVGKGSIAEFELVDDFILQDTTRYNVIPKFPIFQPVIQVFSEGFFNIIFPIFEEAT